MVTAVASYFYYYDGYPQGMNYVAGMLLLVIEDEEAAFWLLDTLLTTTLPGTVLLVYCCHALDTSVIRFVGNFLPAGLYDESMHAVNVAARVMVEVVR